MKHFAWPLVFLLLLCANPLPSPPRAAKTIPDLAIMNQKGMPGGLLKHAKSVLIKDLPEKVALNRKDPKLYSSYYFTFAASDGYRVVYPGNEIFNSPIGNNLYMVTSIQNEFL